MLTLLIIAIVGIVFLSIGVSNIKGNIQSIHSYHRHSVSEKYKLVFGKLMGIGMIICGVGIILISFLFFISYITNKTIYFVIGTVLTIFSLFIGKGIMIYTTIKYNKGIF